MDEYLDILDRKGNRTGKKALRKEVHSKGLWHKGVHIWKEEVSEVKNIYYKDFEKMIKNKDKDIVNHPEEWEKLFKILHEKYD